MRIHSAARMVALLAAIAPAAGSAQYPTTPPPPAPIRPAVFPPFREATLANGLRLIVVQSRKQPVVALTLAFPAGEMYDPHGKSGLADMVAGLLTKGAGTRSADDVAAAIEGVGGSLNASAGQDFLFISSNVLANDARLAFSLVADAAIRPAFAERELQLLRTQTLTGLQLEQSQPSGIAQRAFAQALYGDHPYGRRADPASVNAITRDDLVRFHHDRVTPSGALLVVSGSLSLAQAKVFAEQAFAGWTGAPAVVTAPPAPPVRTATQILLVHRPGSVQSTLLVGDLTWPPTDQRSYAATIVNKLLGGGANARLFLVLREQKGWTYGAYSSMVRYRGQGYFLATAEVRTAVTDSALVELLAQLRRVGTEPIPAPELDEAKNALTGAFPLTIETANSVASQVATARLLGLPADYVQTYRQRLAAVTAAQAAAAAGAAIRPDQALIVVVGDGAKIYDKLKAIAPVRIVSPEGNVLTPNDLTAKAAAPDFAFDRIVARADSFTVLVQGNPFGWQTSRLERADGGWKYTESTRLGAALQQTTEVTFGDRLEMRSVHQTGKVQAMETKIDVAYANGHAKGSAATPGPTGIRNVAVDADVSAGAIDDNLITAILPALHWANGAKFTVPVFQSGKGTASTLTIAVQGEESVKVVAGTFDAWKAEMTGGDQPVTLWVEKAAPYRLLKLAFVGAPIEFQLAK